MRSNLRAPKGIAIRVALAANPGGPGHHWIARRYVFRSAPWTPFVEPTSKRTWVHCPSTVTDNEFIDREIIDARVWGGIHWRSSCVRGRAVGQQVGDYVFDHALVPKHRRPSQR
jgi:hypothetical protein